MYVGLRKRRVSNTFEVSWQTSNFIPPYEQLLYNQSVLQNSVLQDTEPEGYFFIMKKENSQIVFKPAADMDYKTLCFSNRLKLRWA